MILPPVVHFDCNRNINNFLFWPGERSSVSIWSLWNCKKTMLGINWYYSWPFKCKGNFCNCFSKPYWLCKYLKTIDFFYNSRLFRRIQQNKFLKKLETWAGIEPRSPGTLTITPNWGCNSILFRHGEFCPIRLIHLIGRKSLHFEKKEAPTAV